MFQKWNLKKQFVTAFFLFITLPTILFGILIYFQATDAFTKQAEESTTARLEKNDENLITIIRDMEAMTSYMTFDENFRTFFTISEDNIQQSRLVEDSIRGYFTFQLMSNAYIDSITLTGSHGNQLHFGTPVKGDENVYTAAAEAKNGAPFWSDSYELESGWGGTKKVVSLTRVINDLNDIDEQIGLVRIRLDETALYRQIEANASQQGQYFVLSDTGEVVLHPDSSLVGQTYPNQEITELILNSDNQSITYRGGNENLLLVKNPIAGTDWFSVVSVTQEEVVGGLYQVRNLIVNMIVLLIVLGILTFLGFYFFHVKRITELTNQTKQLSQGDFTAKVKVNSQDEIGKLGTYFNHMVETIRQFIDREYKLKIKQKESELKALQNQIDPHFLYNTLDMIRWTARLENAMETGQLIERLSKMFRMNLNEGKVWVTVEEELAYIKSYLELQQYRMGERLQFHIFYEEQVKGVFVMKQLIQPLVENSILHGFKDLPRHGKIYIRSYLEGDSLCIDIIDNGWGFPEDLEALTASPGSGYALKNLHDRLELAFGERYSMEKVEAKTEGTWIRIKVPVYDKHDIQLISKETGGRNEIQNADSG